MIHRTRAAAIRDRKGRPFATITAYDAAFGRAAEAAGIDLILVGDSLGNVVLGYASTASVTLEDMERHGAAVVRGTERAHVSVDMPFMSYEASNAEAIHSAGRLVRVGASSVKLEGGVERAERIAAIVSAGIPVIAHIGVVPQTAALDRGFRRRTDRERLIADADAIAAAGAFAVVLEMIDPAIAGEITARIPIPTIGIGSGGACDAQILVLYDLLGLSDFSPPFVKPYAKLADVVTAAMRHYAEDVAAGRDPADGPSARGG
ncbi:MAG TPA: 3-methyl-2-oxobutanoate hydroxymethyltransferase [Candidatus Aquilonibacter sp.]